MREKLGGFFFHRGEACVHKAGKIIIARDKLGGKFANRVRGARPRRHFISANGGDFVRRVKGIESPGHYRA